MRIDRSTFDLFEIVKQIVDVKAQFRSRAEPWADTGIKGDGAGYHPAAAVAARGAHIGLIAYNDHCNGFHQVREIIASTTALPTWSTETAAPAPASGAAPTDPNGNAFAVCS